MFEKIRDHIIERGLKDCRRLLREGKGPEGFYNGAVDGFEACREFGDLPTLQSHIRALEGKEFARRTPCAFGGQSAGPSSLKEWWYWRGYLMQLEFVWDRVSLLESVTYRSWDPSNRVSARAVIDVLELTQRIFPRPGVGSQAAAGQVKDMVGLTKKIKPGQERDDDQA